VPAGWPDRQWPGHGRCSRRRPRCPRTETSAASTGRPGGDRPAWVRVAVRVCRAGR